MGVPGRNHGPRLVVGAHPPAGGYDADIIILSRDRVTETIEAVRSALRQQNASCHVSLLDQGSAPPVRAAFAAAFEGQAHFGFYAIEGNLGVGGGRNFLSGLGAGKCIVALDNDAVFADDLVVANALSRFEAEPALGAIGFKILARDGITLDEFSWGYPPVLKTLAHGAFASTTFVGAGHAIRRQAWVAAGGYDADLFFTWEEYDFSLRAIALNWRLRYDGALAVVHKISPEARVRWDCERMRLFVRNRIIVARKWHTPWLQLLPRIAGYLLKAARNGRLRAAIAGCLQAMAVDQGLAKKVMNRSMRQYLRAHEGRYREGLARSLYRHVVLEMQTEP